MYIGPETSIYEEGEEGGAFFYPLIWLICGIVIILKGNMNHFAGVEWLDIDLIPVFLVYFIAKNKIVLAACLAFLMGILTDISAPCQLGLFALVYSTIVLGTSHCQKFLDFNNIKTQILVVAIFLLAKWSFLSIVPRVFPKEQSTPSIPIVLLVTSVFITSLSTPLLFYVLNLLQGKEAKTGTIELL
jgi:rod shape-determining protein MreD